MAPGGASIRYGPRGASIRVFPLVRPCQLGAKKYFSKKPFSELTPMGDIKIVILSVCLLQQKMILSARSSVKSCFLFELINKNDLCVCMYTPFMYVCPLRIFSLISADYD